MIMLKGVVILCTVLQRKTIVSRTRHLKSTAIFKTFIEWSEEFVRFSTKWGFDRVLFSKADLDVSKPMKNYIDCMNDGLPSSTLYEAQNAWYSLIEAAGLPTVKQAILHDAHFRALLLNVVETF